MKYRIRDVVWVTLAVGVALGWYVDRSSLAKKLRNFEERMGDDFCVQFDPDYQFFEPADADEYGPIPMAWEYTDVMPFEVRTQNRLDQESRPFQILDSIDDTGSDLPTELRYEGLGPHWCGWVR